MVKQFVTSGLGLRVGLKFNGRYVRVSRNIPTLCACVWGGVGVGVPRGEVVITETKLLSCC